MKHILEQKVYYSDTDAYGVVWHGYYLRWLEMGRVELCEKLGYNLVVLEEQDIVLPVVNMNIKYKASAKLNDEIIVETYIQEYNSLSVTFNQKIFNKFSKKLLLEAAVEVVAINNAGKLYRKMPQFLADAFSKSMKEEVCV